MGGISPRPALAIPPPAKTKVTTTKGQKKKEQTTTKGRIREIERGYSTFFATFVHVKICTA